MFDGLLRELRELERGKEIKVQVQTDDDGYWERRCPDPGCFFDFKVLLQDWKDKVPDERAFCPFCGHSDQPSEFNSPEQSEYFGQAAIAHVRSRISAGLQSGAQRFNAAQPRGGFISLRMDVRSSPIQIPTPPEATDLWKLSITCEQCGCRFAVVGAAYFCPACGHNSAGQIFEQSIAACRNAISSLPDIRKAIPDADIAAQAIAKIIEGSHGLNRPGFPGDSRV